MISRSTTRFLPESFREPRNRLLGEASELLRPVLALAARAASRGGATDPAAWRRGLIIGHNHIGDVLYRTASLPILSEALPECEWTYLTSPQSAVVLQNNPHVSQVLGFQRGDNAWSLSTNDFARLRRSAFDVAICSNTLRYYPDLLLASALGIPNRVSFVHKGMSAFVTHPVPIEFPSSYPSYFRAMVASVTRAEPKWSLRPQVFPDEAARTEAARVAGEIEAEHPIVACVLTTRQKHGKWPSEFFIELLSEARRKSQFVVAFCGAPGEEEHVAAVTSSYSSEKSIVAGKLSLLGFAAFLERCAALVTLDSGPRHLANAVRTPVLFIRNMNSSQIETGAYCDSEVDIAPAGEYLTDDQIERVAASASARDAAASLVSLLSRESNSPR